MNDYNDYYNYLNNFNFNNMNSSTNVNNSIMKTNDSLYENEPYNGFIRGNMFDNLYDSYKSYKPYEINPSNERDYSLFLVQMYGFAAHDLNLYLDVYPNDNKAIELRAKYVKLYNQALMNYEGKYGATSLGSDYLNTVPWAWDSKNWPWEGNK